jgi:hypothetical protein
MASKDRSSLARSAKSLQDNVTRSGPVMAASSGLVLGIVVGFYELITTVYRK